MSEANNLYPNTKQEDIEQIIRVQRDFSGGMQPDKKPENLDHNAVTDLSNMRGSTQGLRGRHGSTLVNTTTLPTVLDNITTLTRDLENITSSVAIFTEDMFDFKIKVSDTEFYTIKEIVNASEVNVIGKDTTGSGAIVSASMRGPINAFFYEEFEHREYYLIGKEVYTRTGHGDFSESYYIHSSIKPTSSYSTFFKVGQFICLNNSNGIFVLNDPNDSLYGWRANSYIPHYKLDKMENSASDSVDTFAYNAAYTYTRMKGDYRKNRLNSATFIENETPPRSSAYEDAPEYNSENGYPDYTGDTTKRDITTLYYDSPLLDTFGIKLSVSVEAYTSGKTWKALYENDFETYIKIKYNDIWHTCFISFYNVNTFRDVSKSIKRALYASVGKTINVTTIKEGAFDLGILLYANEPNVSIEIASGEDAHGHDIVGWTGTTRYLTLDATPFYLGKSVGWFRYPEDRVDVTHYSYYRTPEEIGNTIQQNPDLTTYIPAKTDLLGWIDDVPVCKLFNIGIAGGVVTFNDFSFSEHDIECTLFTTSGYVLLIRKTTNAGDFVAIGYTGPDDADITCYLGAEICVQFSQTDNIVTPLFVEFGSPTEDFIGKMIFWSDGQTSTVTGITDDLLSFKVMDYNTRNEYGVMNPTYRSFNDFLDEPTVIGYMQSRDFILSTRFYERMPDTNVTALNSGILLAAKYDDNKLVFSNTDNISKIGFHNGIEQFNDYIKNGIKSIIIVNNQFVISTTDTYTINPKQSISSGDSNFGNTYSVLPDPVLVVKGIGTTHQSKWGEGFSSGQVLITNEPAVRVFDGIRYGEDLSKGFIKRTYLRAMDSLVLVGVDKNSGFFLWSKTS